MPLYKTKYKYFVWKLLGKSKGNTHRMGMSSSQARLLSLTARQHDVELRAQMLEAQKLQMANDSDRVYNTYLEALSATKIQARVYDQYEGDTFKDATLAMLVNAAIPADQRDAGKDYASQPLFLQEISTGRIMITPEYADYIGYEPGVDIINGRTLEEYLTDKFGDKTSGKGKYDTPVDNPYATYTKHIEQKTIEDPFNITNYSYNGTSNITQYKYNIATNLTTANTDEMPNPDYNSFYNTSYQQYVTGTAGEGQISLPSGTKTIDSVAGTTTLSSGTYTVSTKEELLKLQDMTIGAGATVILMDDIDMSEVTDWEGITSCAGTFNGNQHTISGLTGSQGLFQAVEVGGTVENVRMADVDLVNNASEYPGLGGIAGINEGTIANCVVDGKLDGDGRVAGIAGHNNSTSALIQDCKAYTTITTTKYCNGGIAGHNNGQVIGCLAGGSIEGGTQSGGLVGHNTGTTVITDSETYVEMKTSNSTTGLVIGAGGNKSQLTIDNVSYKEVDGQYICGDDHSFTGTAGQFKKTVTVPHINDDGTGDLYYNIYTKVLAYKGYNQTGNAKAYEAEHAQLEENIKKYILNIYDPTKEDTYSDEYKNEQLLKLANINAALLAGNTDLMTMLIDDIENNTTNTADDTTQAWHNEYTSTEYKGAIAESNTKSENAELMSLQKGTITIPNEDDIVEMLVNMAKLEGDVKTDAEVADVRTKFEKWVASFNENGKDNRIYLVNIANLLAEYGENWNKSMKQDDRMKALEIYKQATNPNSGVYTALGLPNGVLEADLANYNIVENGTATVTCTQAQTTEDIPYYTYEWNWSNPEIASAVEFYNLNQYGFIIIGDNDAATNMPYESANSAESTNWLTNVINCGIAQFVKFNITNPDELPKGEDGVPKFTMEQISGTSLASETSLQEVADKTFLAAAEATYEKDMKAINRKETKIDTQLSALEAERSSIKMEQDGLKKVINDNVDLTFKLFS